jgi:LCP family protein required for cell wall assembly
MTATLEEVLSELPSRRHARGSTPKQKRRRRRRRIWITLLVVFAAFVGIPCAVVIALLATVSSSYSSNVTVLSDDQAFPNADTRPAAPTDGSQNFLLLGSDSRVGLGDVEDGDATDQRSDTMLLVHVSADKQDVSVMSLMRDLWVTIPGHGEAKLNAAFSYGGVPLAVQTVEGLLGVRIAHIAVIDFEGLKDMSTALGGVDVYSSQAFTSQNMPGFSYVKGINHLQGDAALAFVRERYSFADSDYQRVRNQQAFLKGIVSTLSTPKNLLDVGKLNTFIGATSRYLTVDKGLDFSALVGIGYGMSTSVHFFTLPTAGTGTSADGQSIVLLDQTALDGLASAYQADSVGNYLATNNLLNGN